MVPARIFKHVGRRILDGTSIIFGKPGEDAEDDGADGNVSTRRLRKDMRFLCGFPHRDVSWFLTTACCRQYGLCLWGKNASGLAFHVNFLACLDCQHAQVLERFSSSRPSKPLIRVSNSPHRSCFLHLCKTKSALGAPKRLAGQSIVVSMLHQMTSC